MTKVKIRDDWCEERSLIYAEIDGKRITYELARGKYAWRNLPDEVAERIDLNKFEVQKDIKIPIKKEVKVEEDIKKPDKVLKNKSPVKKSVLARIKEVTEDLLDDGKLNHSNNKSKKSPGRRKKK